MYIVKYDNNCIHFKFPQKLSKQITKIVILFLKATVKSDFVKIFTSIAPKRVYTIIIFLNKDQLHNKIMSHTHMYRIWLYTNLVKISRFYNNSFFYYKKKM